MTHSVKIREEDYKKLKLAAEKTHRTITGMIAYLVDIGLHNFKEIRPVTKRQKRL